MSTDEDTEPDWDMPLTLRLTPEDIVRVLFASADNVHTGWRTCVDPKLVLEDLTVEDETGESHCRLVKQAYVEDKDPDDTWNDWTVEVRLGDVYVVGHWATRESSVPADLDWCSREAENAFATGCLLVGRRVRRGLIVDDPPLSQRPARTHH